MPENHHLTKDLMGAEVIKSLPTMTWKSQILKRHALQDECYCKRQVLQHILAYCQPNPDFLSDFESWINHYHLHWWNHNLMSTNVHMTHLVFCDDPKHWLFFFFCTDTHPIKTYWLNDNIRLLWVIVLIKALQIILFCHVQPNASLIMRVRILLNRDRSK